MIGVKSLRTRCDKVDAFIKVYHGARYLVLFGPEKFDTIYNRIRYLTGQKIYITYAFSHNYAKIKMVLYDSLPLGKKFTLHNVITLIKSLFHKDQNRFYYNVFLEKCLYQLAETY